ncbi:MAG TPA: hypothetical protein VII53_01035 [Solirubrobacteraceae bacterium]
MNQADGVTLQINVAPTDFLHARETLPHQLRQWAGQVQEVIFSFDLHRTERGGRFAEGWEERRGPMQELLDELCGQYPNARVVPVDYGEMTAREIALVFTGGSPVPAKDTKGAPIYPYFHGLWAASHDLVLHLDSDLMFGGSSQTWVVEGSELLAEHPDVLAVSPLPGPPRADGRLSSQSATPFQDRSLAFRFPTLSTRLFMIDRQRLRERILPLQLAGPARLISRVKARLHGNPPYAAVEIAVSEAMAAAGLSRVDFLGASPGMWSLHPPLRSEAFHRALPGLIERIEAGDIPNAQRGDYELNDSMFDWSRARRRARIRRLWA